MLRRRLHHQSSFADIVSARFFHVDMFSRIAGQDGGRGVPVVGRGDPDCIDRGIVQDVSQILGRFRFLPRLILDKFGGGGQAVGVDVTHMGYDDILAPHQFVQVRRAHAARSDEPDAHLFAWSLCRCRAYSQVAGCDGGQSQSRILQELTTIRLSHGKLLRIPAGRSGSGSCCRHAIAKRPDENRHARTA